ncbi:MAG: superoxide dismutase [Fimbriimonadaceae bacterium]
MSTLYLPMTQNNPDVEVAEEQNDLSLTRRSMVSLMAAAGAAAMLGVPKMGSAFWRGNQNVEPKLVSVPQAIPEKVFTSERVGISRKTHEEHLKLWQGYANKTNEIRTALAEMQPMDPAQANQIYSKIRALKVDYTFAYEGLINHNIYFETLGGEGGPATGKIAELINEAYGSFDNWAADFKSTGIGGRGWAFLAYDHDEGRVFNYIGDAQNTFPIWNHTCVLALDVYEHAYYLDFQTARARYIDAYMQCIDWNAVNNLLPRGI